MKIRFNTKYVGYILLVVPCITCFLVGFLTRSYFDDYFDHIMKNPAEVRQGGYRLTNPLIDCEIAGPKARFKELKPFEDELAQYIDEKKKHGWADHVALYFRDLNNGAYFGIDMDNRFAPASLLKIPVMIAVFKEAEKNPRLLSRKVKYTGAGKDYNAQENIRPSKTIEAGKDYTLDELVYRMIVYSDNNADMLLLTYANMDFFIREYRDLGVKGAFQGNLEDFLTVQEYATFFRVLYNASYLNKEFSEKALDYLTQVEFRDGLVAGVPAGVPVAHKFGERVFGDNNAVKQLHDCGIVYYPGSPYLLCVMSSGGSFEYLDDMIREISHMVYSKVDKLHSGK